MMDVYNITAVTTVKSIMDGQDFLMNAKRFRSFNCGTVLTEDAENVKEGDIISFFDPAGNGTSIVTHRVTEVTTEGGELAFRTKGDANNVEDSMPVPADKLVAVYRNRIPNMGNVAMFMQTTTGLIVCVVCPILLLVGYDMIRRRKYEKSSKEDTDALLRELEELRAQKAAKEQEK